MLFDMSASSNSRKIMLLNPDYPEDVTVKATDGIATFRALIAKKGRPDEYTYQWYVDGIAVEGAMEAVYVRDVTGDKGQHTVWCDITNKAGTVRTRNARLTVYRLPVLDAGYPADTAVTVAKSADFAVEIAEAGYCEKYTYQWYVNGVPVEGETSAIYTRVGAKIESESIYCVVTNEAGSVQSRTATFTTEAEYVLVNNTFKDGSTWGVHNGSYGQGNIYHENGCLVMWCDGIGTQRVWSANTYDFTGKNKLVFHCDALVNQWEGAAGTIYFGASDTQNDDNFVAVATVPGHDSGEAWFSVDVSNLSGKHYIKVCIIRNVYHADTVYLRDVYFE